LTVKPEARSGLGAQISGSISYRLVVDGQLLPAGRQKGATVEGDDEKVSTIERARQAEISTAGIAIVADLSRSSFA
jgi:hypothetical protein